MSRTVLARLGALLAALALIATVLAVSSPPAAALSSTVVISQVYGGGGNSGAPYRNDFVELFNRGATTASLNGWSIQYASATGAGLFSASVTPLSGSLSPGQYYLVRMASGGASGALLPTPDASGTTAMSATAGKVVLVNTTTGLAGNGSPTEPIPPAQLAMIIDLVGWGTANFYEGTAAPATSNTTALLRNRSGCAETDNNLVDFSVGAPNPRNTSSPLNPCAVAPAITAQPADQTVCSGSLATFTAAASGSPAPTVKWQVSSDGSTWADIPGATSATLSFAATASQTGHTYRAVFTNNLGTATSNAATLTVNTPPVVTTQPVDQTVDDGQSVTFTAGASGSPAPTVKWQVSGDGGGTWNDVPGATSATLAFTAAATQTGYRYRAVFTNTCTAVTTNAATLTVTPPLVVISQIYGGGGNSGATLKSDFIELFNRGTTTASLDGWSVQYASTTGSTWFRTNLSGTIAPNHYYLIKEYTGPGGTVDLPPPDATGVITIDQARGKVVLVTNQTTILTGTVCPTGSSIVDKVGYGSGTNCFEGLGPAPTLSNTTAAVRLGEGCIDTNDNAHDFRAAAPNPRNTASPPNSCTAPTLTAEPFDQTVCAGSTATFLAAASGSPAPSVQWQESSDGSTWADIPGATSATLNLTATASQSGLRYRAVFTNDLGTVTTAAAVLTVNTPPTITTQPVDTTVDDGLTATFTAAASGSPAPAVKWQESSDGYTWSDISGATSTTLSFRATVSQNGYRYRAVFTNGCGTATTNAASLTVVFVTILPATLPDAVKGVTYTQALQAVGGTAPYAFVVTAGSLPPGLRLSRDGLLSGTPTAVGTTSFTITATDAAGRSASRSYSLSVRYGFSGLGSQQWDSSKVNVALAGATLQVLFSLGGNQGRGIFVAGMPASQPVSCATLAPLGPLSPTRPQGASGLFYQPIAKTYMYLWTTNLSWAGTCRKFVMTLNDGSTHTMYVRFVSHVGPWT